MRTLRRTISSYFGNALGGVKGRQNAAAWVVACTVAYFLWIKPDRDAQREEEARAILRREADLHRYVQKTRPLADPQIISQHGARATRQPKLVEETGLFMSSDAREMQLSALYRSLCYELAIAPDFKSILCSPTEGGTY